MKLLASVLAIVIALQLVGCEKVARREQLQRITEPQRLAKIREMLPLPQAFVRPVDQQRAKMLRVGYAVPFPCADIGGGDDRCFKFGEARRWSGLWRNEMEGSDFCAAPARKCPSESAKLEDEVWLDFAPDVKPGVQLGRGGLYAVEFIGRRSLHPGIFGHFGMWKNDIIVDRLISMKLLEPPPPEPTKAQVIADWKKCEAEHSCIPNWQMINSTKE